MAQIDKLAACSAVMYDVEILRAIPVKNEVRDQRLQYCGGWEDYEGMGISVVTSYDFVTNDFGVYLQDNLSELRTLFNSRRVIIGFNNRRFDDNVLAANGIHVASEKSYDLFLQIIRTQPEGQRSGFSLKRMLACNGIVEKSDLGSNAPMLAQTGQWGRLITYGLGDTNKQALLMRKAVAGTMVNPNHGGFMQIKMPWEVLGIEMDGLF